MSYLTFKKDELVYLPYSLSKEMLCTNRAGSYMCTTIIGCNTRKYHGLLVCSIDKFNGESFVLLSTLDETIIQHDKEFNLGIHQYPEGVFFPKGHKYIVDFDYEPTPTLTYGVGDILLKKEFVMEHNADRLMIRYTLSESSSSIKLKLRPFLAFRNRHDLSKANLFVDTDAETINNGIATQLYQDFPTLNLQLSKQNEFVKEADWYYNIEYIQEKERGYEYLEDLYTPGFFEVELKQGDSIIFSASLKEENVRSITTAFNREISQRVPKDSFIDCLKNSAAQFLVERDRNTEVIAGYPWFGRWGRDTFIALPGLTLAANYDIKSCKNVLDTMSSELSQGLFPNIGKKDQAAYNSADAPMWYFWSIQKYAEVQQDAKAIWKSYGKKMKEILSVYRSAENPYIQMHKNGLIWQGQEGKALTWMDAIIHEGPVTPRRGYAVEINALWYNAIQFTIELARANNDIKFVEEWSEIADLVKTNFVSTFWNQNRLYLADYVDEKGQNLDIRSNQVIATSLPYSPINDEIKSHVLNTIKKELLTPKGLRTLSPRHPDYKGTYAGDQKTRDLAYHQGTVWVWQLSHYIEGNFKLYGKSFYKDAQLIVNHFEEDMTDYGICSIAEVYDGNPPHHPGGSISQAWSVSEILRILQLMEQYKK